MAQSEGERKLPWKERLLPSGRMRVFKTTIPDSLFEFATRIPVLEKIVIRRYYRQRFWEKWFTSAQDTLKGMTPLEAARDPEGRELLERLLLQWKMSGEKSWWELYWARRRLRRSSDEA